MGTYERLDREGDPADGPKLVELSVRIQFDLLELRNAMQAELRAVEVAQPSLSGVE
jgi:hypothetical protein